MTTTDTVTHRGDHMSTSIRRDDATGTLTVALTLTHTVGLLVPVTVGIKLTPKEAAELAQRLYALALEVASANR